MNLDKYKAIAESHKIKDVVLISPDRIFFDIKAVLKCRWGCEFSKMPGIRCDTRNLSVEERKQIVTSYRNILLLHGHDGHELSRACLDIERELFLDGYYFAFTLRTCNYCKKCSVKKGGKCAHPEKVRPCEEMFGIDVFRTVRGLGLPVEPLKNEGDTQNRYGFVLVE